MADVALLLRRVMGSPGLTRVKPCQPLTTPRVRVGCLPYMWRPLRHQTLGPWTGPWLSLFFNIFLRERA